MTAPTEYGRRHRDTEDTERNNAHDSSVAGLPPSPACGTPEFMSAASSVGWLVSCIGCPALYFAGRRQGAESAWCSRVTEGELSRH